MKKVIYLLMLFYPFMSNCFAQAEGQDNVYSTGKILNEERQGPWIFYKDGVIARISYYKNDVLNGLTLQFYDKGSLSRELPFNKGKLDGRAKFYSQEGELVAIYVYKNDLFVKTIFQKASPDAPPKGHGYYPLLKD